MQRLNHIVLIHGAAHSGACWEYLAPLLRDMGYRVTTPDLPGLGDDRTPLKDVTLQSYIDRAVQTVKAAGEPVLLVGHSMGGSVVCGAAEAISEQVGKLVFVAGLMHQNGDAMLDLMRPFLPSLPEPSADGTLELDFAHAADMFYNTCSPEIVKRAITLLRPQPFAPFKSPLHLTPGRYGKVPKTYIVCTLDNTLPAAVQESFCARAPDVKKREMNTDHSPFYCDPKGLAAILDEEARL
jgi:pimeloyl-ACP methyl ester carboxylesterase